MRPVVLLAVMVMLGVGAPPASGAERVRYEIAGTSIPNSLTGSPVIPRMAGQW